MQVSSPQLRLLSLQRLLSAIILMNIACAHDGEDGKWRLLTNSEDKNCSNIVYVSMWGVKCPASESCTLDIQDDDEGNELELYSTYCTELDEEPADIVAYLADGECHPYKTSHFKVVQSGDTVSVIRSWYGCDYEYWNETWAGDINTEINMGKCFTPPGDGSSWKAFLITNNSSTSSTTKITSTSEPVSTDTSNSTDASSSSSSHGTSATTGTSISPAMTFGARLRLCFAARWRWENSDFESGKTCASSTQYLLVSFSISFPTLFKHFEIGKAVVIFMATQHQDLITK
ncbi:hypothetical protein PC113_g18443 [Phytophthora cactorum]|uniref:LysM domain-containing protein n=1 Tax=Phytophthora cactorum TaxID=29920 RepID=A0A8T0YHZ4_9STRA|nr:hypothetical protein PC113_g18443 [Phytophthora cactorum]